jgi:hypothetical protein
VDHIVNGLGLSNVPGLHKYFYHQDIDSLPLRVNKSLHAMDIHPHSIYIIDNKPIILFFEANADYKKVFKQCWNFSEAPIIIIEDNNSFEVYNGFEFILENGELLLEKLKKDDLNYISLLSGRYLQSIKSFQDKTNRLDKKLLDNIRNAREELLKNGLLKEIANGLLGRIIFIRYLIDRKIMLNFDGQKKLLTNDDLKKILMDKNQTYKLFKYLKSSNGFNGDWFPIIEDATRNVYEENLVTDEHLQTLRDLISGTEIKTRQQSLFDFYDFSIIPIEFISNVYESFIGEDEQSKNGAYYTPTFLVDYILKHTVDEYFKKNPQEYNCKVLDPACGSGIFLVETLRKLIKQFEKVKKRKIEPSEIVKLVEDNIFAIDKDRNAVLISVFSIYLTMLDYQDPKDIEQFVFPYLLKSSKNSSPNFFEDDFFDTEADFNQILQKNNLNFIIGNPPYGRGIAKNNSFVKKYIQHNNIMIGNQDIVQPFMVRVNDILSSSTKISLIVTSKVLYNLQSSEFRKKSFVSQFKINHIMELSSVMKDIFENATVPISILFYEKSTKEEIDKNNIDYISLKPSPFFDNLKMFLIAKSDYKKVNQKKLLDHDYLWKILVYGSFLDFNLITRLKTLRTIDSYIKTKNIGITVGNKKHPVPIEYLDLPYIRSADFKPFYIDSSSTIKWEDNYAERIRNKEVFKAPSLLILKGINLNLNVKTGILKQDSIFTGSITAVKCNSEDTLYGIMGFLNSSFFKYFIMQTGSSIGVERPQVHNPEKFALPYIENSSIIQSARQLEKCAEEEFFDNNATFNQLKNNLDTQILDALKLTDVELSLINYSNEITLPWIMHKQYNIVFQKLSFMSPLLIDYANIFIEYFSIIYSKSSQYFSANIIYSEYAIAIKFQVSHQEFSQKITWTKNARIEKFVQLANSQPLETLFIQKDIKGFEDDGFYVIKPNEYKNWHKAIGYLDLNEFQNALLRSKV